MRCLSLLVDRMGESASVESCPVAGPPDLTEDMELDDRDRELDKILNQMKDDIIQTEVELCSGIHL